MASIPSINKSYIQWPDNLNDVGVTEENKAIIDHVLNTFYTRVENGENITADFLKTDEKERFFQIIDLSTQTEEVLEKYPIPLSLDLRFDEAKIILIGKNIIGEGVERKVKAAHDLFNGIPFVKKEINQENELEIYELIQNKPSPGLPKNFCFRGQGTAKLQVLEERLTGPLYVALQRHIFRTDTLKLNAIKELAQGLHTLHHFKLKNNAPCSHCDIKIENILFNDDGSVQWTDFGYSGQVEQLVGSPSYQSPEHVAMKVKVFPNGIEDNGTVTAEEIATYCKTYGQPVDIWAFGIVLLSILKNADVYCLDLIDEAMKQSESHPYHKDFEIQFLKQEDIAAEIAAWKSKSSPIKQALLDIAEKMLQVDPEQRINIDDVLDLLSQI